MYNGEEDSCISRSFFCDEWCLPLAEEEVGRAIVESLAGRRSHISTWGQSSRTFYSLISFCAAEKLKIISDRTNSIVRRKFGCDSHILGFTYGHVGVTHQFLQHAQLLDRIFLRILFPGFMPRTAAAVLCLPALLLLPAIAVRRPFGAVTGRFLTL